LERQSRRKDIEARLMRWCRTVWRRAMNDHDINDDDTSTGIDDDRAEGSLKQTGGKLKEGAGKLFGDEKMKREGQADQGEGKLQNAWGSLKDEARETFSDDDDI
jgi:uncharacterized protein YjbJ (UPF0337 family)